MSIPNRQDETDADLVDRLTKEYGEHCRRLLADALDWLHTREPIWKVSLNREEFMRDLMKKVR